MKVYRELVGFSPSGHDTFNEFAAWSGGKDRLDSVFELGIESEVWDELESVAECYEDGMSETEINDYLWFDESFNARLEYAEERHKKGLPFVWAHDLDEMKEASEEAEREEDEEEDEETAE